MSVKIYKVGGTGGGATTSLKGVHSIVNLEVGQASSQCIHSSNLTTLICTNGLVVSAPFIPNQTFDANSFSIFVNTAQAGKNARVMVYSNTDTLGTAGLPNALLRETSNMSLASTGKVTDADNNVTFTEGVTYWLAVQTDATTAILSAIPVGNLLCIANNINDGTPLSVYTGTSNYEDDGAQDPFSNYTSTAYGITAMPLVMINVV